MMSQYQPVLYKDFKGAKYFVILFMHYVLAVRKIMKNLQKGLKAVLDNSQYKAFIQVTIFQTIKLQSHFKAKYENSVYI